MTTPRLKNYQKVRLRMAAHSLLKSTFVANGMTEEEASKNALRAVQSMTPAKLYKTVHPE